MTRECVWGMCSERAAETVTSPTALGIRIEVMCAPHAERQREQNDLLLARWRELGCAREDQEAMAA